MTLLHEQYHYSWATAAVEGFHLARAAATFGDLKDHYEVVLPGSGGACGQVRRGPARRFDARAVARAELAWWEARRIPGQQQRRSRWGSSSPRSTRCCDESSPQAMAAAGAAARAQAAALRDAHADSRTGRTIASAPEESHHRELRLALSSANV